MVSRYEPFSNFSPQETWKHTAEGNGTINSIIFWTWKCHSLYWQDPARYFRYLKTSFLGKVCGEKKNCSYQTWWQVRDWMCVTYDTSLMCLAVGWMMELDKYGVVLMSAGRLFGGGAICMQLLTANFIHIQYIRIHTMIQLSNDEC